MPPLNPPLPPADGTVLCTLSSLPDNIGSEIVLKRTDGHKPYRLFIVRQGDRVWAYENACSHFGVPLNPGADHTFLSPDGKAIRCQHHGALFAIEDGRCLKGDCDGEPLTAINIHINNGIIIVGPAP